jgi:hypothetical protein
MNKPRYYILQFLILLLPGLIVTMAFQVNEYIDVFSTELLLNISGFILVLPLWFLSEGILAPITNESFSSLVAIVIYLGLSFSIFRYYYLPLKNRIILVSLVNAGLSFWSLFVGQFLMIAAMQ